MKKRLFSVLLVFALLAALLPLSALAASEVSSGKCGVNLTWKLNSDGVLAVSGTGAMYNYDEDNPAPWVPFAQVITSVTVSEGVTAIGSNAFAYCIAMQSASLPSSLTRLGDNAFWACGSLESAPLPEALQSIGEGAFYFCTALKSAAIGEKVTSIGSGALAYCTSLESISVAAGNTRYCTADSVLFNKAKTELITYPAQKAGSSYSVPESVKTITAGAFMACTGLSSVSIPEGVERIGNGAFFGCTGLDTISIPKSVTSIGELAFDSCGCISTVNYGGSAAQWNAISIGASNEPLLAANVVYSGAAATEIDSGECGSDSCWIFDSEGTLTIRGWGSMPDWENPPWKQYAETTKQIVVESGITRVGSYAFAEFTNIVYVSLPATLLDIGSHAFEMCWSLENIKLPSSLSTIGANAFFNCNSLKSIKIPSDVSSLGSDAFSVCFALESIDVDEDNAYFTSRSGVLFNKDLSELICFPCGKGGDYSVPAGVKTVGSSAFSCNQQLGSVILTSGVTEIGAAAFSESTLTELFIPASVKTVGDAAFENCTALRKVRYGGTEAQWSSMAIGSRNECLTTAELECGAKDTSANPFTDVADTAYYKNAVLWAYYHEPQITGGNTISTFNPQGACTRAQIVTFLWRANGCPEPKSSSCSFTDVPEGIYYYKAVLWAVENGITGGYNATTFGSNDKVTRAQAVTFMWRSMGCPEPQSTSCSFADVPVGSYYYKAVLWAGENGITGGYDAYTFGSSDGCTRAQIVTFLYRLLG